jgi:dTDP-4-dehydrorhamnose reductase
MRLLVTGAGGQVGRELSRSLMPLGEVITLHRGDCDLSRPAQLPTLIRNLKPDVIVNAAAYNTVDKAEQEERPATTVNGAAVGMLAEEARRAGTLLIHYSTDYVFDGLKSGPYTEDDVPHPINAYGRSKLAGEIAIRQAAGHYLVLRTSWVFAAYGHNFVRTILRLADEREELRIVDGQIGAPTWARNIADATILIIATSFRERTENRFVSGFFNLTSSGATSWHGFAEALLKDAVRPALRRPVLHPIPSNERPSAAARPKNSRLAGDRLNRRFGIALPNWRQGLSLCLKEMV